MNKRAKNCTQKDKNWKNITKNKFLFKRRENQISNTEDLKKICVAGQSNERNGWLLRFDHRYLQLSTTTYL